MELRHDAHDNCLKLLRRATAPPPRYRHDKNLPQIRSFIGLILLLFLSCRRVSYHDSAETVQMRLHKSLKLWSLYADLEESFGTFKVNFISHCILQHLQYMIMYCYTESAKSLPCHELVLSRQYQ